MKYASLYIVGGAALLAQPWAACAQSADAEDGADTRQGLEEIVVTARKRSETLQNVPVAVSVIGSETIQRSLATDLSKVAELAPQVSIGAGGSGTGAVITIRGISSASGDPALEQSVAVEFDNVPISRGRIVTAALFDIAQVQVLQGPQALFFGKNSPAGVISINSNDPTNTFEAYLTTSYEFVARQISLEGAISGPVTSTLSARLAGRVSDMRGWIKNVAPSRPDFINPSVVVPGAASDYSPGTKSGAIRGTLLWEPASGLEAKLKVLYNKEQRADNTSEPFCIGSTTTPVLQGVRPLVDSDCEKNMVKAVGAAAPIYAANIPYSNGGVPYYNGEIGLASLSLKKTFDVGSLISTTGRYIQVDKQMAISDWSTLATIWSSLREKYTLWTQELRFETDLEGPINGMIGGYYESSRRELFNASDQNHVFNTQANSYANGHMSSLMNSEYLSAFAQVNWNILDNLELSAGARYSKDMKNLAAANTEVLPSLAASRYPRGEILRVDYSDEHISPEATLTWHPQPDMTVYASYKTGYKGGGVSNPFTLPRTASASNLRFQPEEAKGFEVGYKASLLGGNLRFDVTAYNYDYKNLQVVSFNVTTFSQLLQNAATAHLRGIQGSFNWLVAEGLTLNGNLGYNKAKYTEFRDAPCYAGQTAAAGCAGTGTQRTQDLSGKALLRAPELTYSIGAVYEAAVSEALETTWSVQASHSSSYEAATDYAPAGHQAGYWLLNASVSVGSVDDKFKLSLIGRNLTNSYYMLHSNGWSGSNNPDQQIGWFNRPREIAVQGTVRF